MKHIRVDNGDELWQEGTESLLHDHLGRWELFELDQDKDAPQKQPRSLGESEAIGILERFGALRDFQVDQARAELKAALEEYNTAQAQLAKSCHRARSALRILKGGV